jgi:hypothetical protein
MQTKYNRPAVRNSKPLASRKKAGLRIAKPAFCANHSQLSQVDLVKFADSNDPTTRDFPKNEQFIPQKMTNRNSLDSLGKELRTSSLR